MLGLSPVVGLLWQVQLLPSPQDVSRYHVVLLLAPCRYNFKQQPARMVGQYKGARMHPEVAGWLHANWFADSNAAIARMRAGGKPQPEAWP